MNAVVNSNLTGALVPQPVGIRAYSTAIGRFGLLERGREQLLARRWQEGRDKRATDELITTHLRLAAKVARGYKGYGLPMADLIAEANLGLVIAAGRFEPGYEPRFSSYALWWIKATMHEYIRHSAAEAHDSSIADPFQGSYFYFSGSANNLRNRMAKAFTLGVGATLDAKVNYGIEVDYDYANVVVSTDGGATWQTVPTNLSNSTAETNGIDGFSSGWVDLHADLSAYTGNVMVGFAYASDGGVNYDGFMIDNIQISGSALDGAETDTGWTYTPAGGFRRTTGTEEKLYNQYYVAEYRTYKGYDLGLQLGPYYFGYAEKPQYADRIAYQDGLLINYWDTSQKDNNTGLHPGQGLLLTIDAHPQALKLCGGPAIWRNRVQSYLKWFFV